MSRTEQPRRREFSWALVTLTTATVLAGCSSVGSSIPHAVGGLPEGAPAQPADPAAFPAVHDMPPPRAEAVLSADERKKLQADLAAARDGATRRAAEADAKTDDGKPKAQAKAAKPKTETKPGEKLEAEAR
jgi:hypothetical protein